MRFTCLKQKLNFTIYFANPHTLLRDLFPKDSDFQKITAAKIAKVQRVLNHRPRKCLNDGLGSWFTVGITLFMFGRQIAVGETRQAIA